jgi:hypothetical protein
MAYVHFGSAPVGAASGSTSPGGDYMAVPTARRMRAQADAVVAWVEKAQAAQRPLEDWLESKLTRAAHDLDDVHNFVVYSDVARIR